MRVKGVRCVMKEKDLRELRAKLAELPVEMTAENQSVFAEFGQLCAVKYVPQLMQAAGLHKETPEFDMKSCDSCFWIHQSIRAGCAKCVDKSEYINVFNPDAVQRRTEYYSELSKSQE